MQIIHDIPNILTIFQMDYIHHQVTDFGLKNSFKSIWQ